MKFALLSLCVTILLLTVPVFAPTNDPNETYTNYTCYDSDGGINYFVYGELLINNDLIARDTCSLISEMCTTAACSEQNYGKGQYLVEWYFEGCEQKHKVIKCEYRCENGACLEAPEPQVKCFDSDGGQDIYEPGVTEGVVYPHGEEGRVVDYCLNPSGSLALYESYCDSDTDQVMTVMMYCPEGYKCVNREKEQYGYCMKAEDIECTDSDGGENLLEQGTVTHRVGDERKSSTDYCVDETLLVEYSCKDNMLYGRSIYCSEMGKVCRDGRCIGTEEKCYDSDGVNYYTKGYVEDGTGRRVEDYCKGNELVEYVCKEGSIADSFFVCSSGCRDGACVKPEAVSPLQPPEWECPVEKVCPDGVTKPCQIEDAQCVCKPCPLPSGCFERVDPTTGFVQRVCEVTAVPVAPACPPVSTEAVEKCKMNGGTPAYRRDNRGCEYIDCVFEGEVTEFFEVRPCPPKEEIYIVLKKCEEMGMRGVIVEESGCRFAKCMVSEEAMECADITAETKERIRIDCENQGLDVVKDFDPNGCPVLRCGRPNECQQYIPDEAFDKCEKEGGKLVVKKDEKGCVIFMDCVMRGEEKEVYYETEVNVPETGELLSMAFKLEELKMQFDMLGRKADSIADYYKSISSSEENKFRRIADMFNSAAKKVDDIKRKIRDRLDSITEEDVREIKKDIKYLKDVMLKDILYLMLSGEDIEEPEGPIDCGNNGECFHRALRICQPAKMGTENLTITITGLEDGRCVIEATSSTMGDMVCKVPDYSLGIENPKEQLFPYCEGSLVAVLESESEPKV